MSKRFGFCEAGCKREVVAKEDYDAKVAELEQEITTLQNELVAMEDRVSEWKPIGTEATATLGNTYRIKTSVGAENWGASMIIRYNVNGEQLTKELALPELKHKYYFDVEFVDFYTDYNDGMGILVYKIDGVEKTLEWDHNGAVIELVCVDIYATYNIYQYFFGDNGEYLEEVVDLEVEELLKGDY